MNCENCNVILSYNATNGDLDGFNLVGNPYPCAIPCARPYYTLNPDGTWTAHPNGGTGTLTAYDLLDRLIFSFEIQNLKFENNSQFEIQNSKLPFSGVYLLHLDGKTQKVVIR